jgi:hypothetical protein
MAIWLLPLDSCHIFPFDTQFLSVMSSAIVSLSFLQILTELEHSGIGRIKEQSARMLGHLVSNAPRLIRPYMEPILKVMHSRWPDWHILSLPCLSMFRRWECFSALRYTEQRRPFLWKQGHIEHI